MPKRWTVSCEKSHSIDLKIIDQELKFTRDFEGEAWNGCLDHTSINKDMTITGDCMKCGHLIAEAF